MKLSDLPPAARAIAARKISGQLARENGPTVEQPVAAVSYWRTNNQTPIIAEVKVLRVRKVTRDFEPTTLIDLAGGKTDEAHTPCWDYWATEAEAVAHLLSVYGGRAKKAALDFEALKAAYPLVPAANPASR